MNTNHRGFHILRLILLGLLTLILAGAALSEGKDKIFPLDKLKPGLKGYGYTVFQGLKVEKFNVEVLAVTQNEKQPGRLILVRLSGAALEKNGGLSAGMSGSPVYIDGKLAGAISYGFENADPFLAMATPIEDMMKLLDVERNNLIGKNTLTSLGTPMYVSGMGRRGYEMVRNSVERYGLQALAVPSLNFPNVNLSKVALEPGSAVGAQLITGDYQMAAIGTVTMIDTQSGNFLAFGHPFTSRGTVDYLAVACYIFQTVKSPVMSFKLGAPLKPVGRVIQDRQNGLLGRLGNTPKLIEVTVKVCDQERSLERQSSFQVVSDEQLYRDLIVAGVTDAVDQTINRLGSGTAKVSVRITLVLPTGGTVAPAVGAVAPAGMAVARAGMAVARAGMAVARAGMAVARAGMAVAPTGATSAPVGAPPASPEVSTLISRENLFFGKDIAVNCLEDLQKLLDILALNEYSAVRVRSVELDIKIQPEQVTARILKLSGTLAKVKPGETVTVTVTAHSYRGADFTVPFTVKLPANLEPGKLTFTVRGGSRGRVAEEGAGQQKRTLVTPAYVSQDKNSLDALLIDCFNAPKNNEFVLEYQPLTGIRSSENGAIFNSSAIFNGGVVQLKAESGYFILGEAQLTLEVVQE